MQSILKLDLKNAVSYWDELQLMQRISLVFGSVFFLYLVTSAVFASRTKGPSRAFSSQSAEVINESSQLFLQDFSRVMLRKGKKNLEVTAKSGRFLPQERVTYLSEAIVRVQRESGKPVTIRSRNARLFMDGEQVKEADLEGAVQVQFDEGITLLTELANFEADSQTIRAPGAVKILGEGYETNGDGMETEIEPGIIRLQRDIRSKFERGATMPKLDVKK